MDINATIIGQFLTFAILVWFTMKYVWPPLTKTLHDREKKIADGLLAAEQSKQELVQAKQTVTVMLREAKQQASQIIEQANSHSSKILEEAKHQAKLENRRALELAQADINREVERAKEALKTQLVNLAVKGAEKIIHQQIDTKGQEDLLNRLITEI